MKTILTIITFLVCNIITACAIIIVWHDTNIVEASIGIEKTAWIIFTIVICIMVALVFNILAFVVRNDFINGDK